MVTCVKCAWQECFFVCVTWDKWWATDNCSLNTALGLFLCSESEILWHSYSEEGSFQVKLSHLRKAPLIYTWNIQYTCSKHRCGYIGMHLIVSLIHFKVTVCVTCVHLYVASWASRASPSALRDSCRWRWGWCSSSHYQWANQLPPALWVEGLVIVKIGQTTIVFLPTYVRLCNNTGSVQDCASAKCAPYIPAKIIKTHEYSPSPVVRAQEERQQSRELHGTKYMPELTKY